MGPNPVAVPREKEATVQARVELFLRKMLRIRAKIQRWEAAVADGEEKLSIACGCRMEVQNPNRRHDGSPPRLPSRCCYATYAATTNGQLRDCGNGQRKLLHGRLNRDAILCKQCCGLALLSCVRNMPRHTRDRDCLTTLIIYS
jgi:hypothetical protein